MSAQQSYLKNEPIKYEGDIPVFSEMDTYVDNYNDISSDHVRMMKEGSDNPWIPEDIWAEMEEVTISLIQKYSTDVLGQGVKKLKILDVGVGLGRLLSKLDALMPNSFDLHGMDIALPYLQKAANRDIKVIMSKIEDIPYQEGYFDFVTCTDVLEHVLDLNHCVEKILSVLKPGGYLIVRVPNRENLSSYLKPDYPYELAHVRGFDENSLRLLFTRIFKCEVLEHKGGLLISNPSLLKYNLPIRGYSRILNLYLSAVRKISNQRFKTQLAKFYYPTEMNIVIRKLI